MTYVELSRTTPDDPAFVELTTALDRELRAQYGEANEPYAALNRLAPGTAAVVMRDGGRPIGCGAFRIREGGRAELKRMYVVPADRGRGVARALLAALEAWAKEQGTAEVILETGTEQHAAIRLYTRSGYARIPAFAPYDGLPHSVCFAKRLD